MYTSKLQWHNKKKVANIFRAGTVLVLPVLLVLSVPPPPAPEVVTVLDPSVLRVVIVRVTIARGVVTATAHHVMEVVNAAASAVDMVVVVVPSAWDALLAAALVLSATPLEAGMFRILLVSEPIQ